VTTLPILSEELGGSYRQAGTFLKFPLYWNIGASLAGFCAMALANRWMGTPRTTRNGLTAHHYDSMLLFVCQGLYGKEGIK